MLCIYLSLKLAIQGLCFKSIERGFAQLGETIQSNSRGTSCSIVLSEFTSPEEEVITQKLHNEGGILVVFILDAVQVCNSLVESSSGHSASLLWVLKDFVMENGVIECKTKLQRVGVAQGLLGDTLRTFVGTEGFLSDLSLLVTRGEFGDVPEEVSLHFVEEHLGFVTL